jgi:hypothetical protein
VATGVDLDEIETTRTEKVLAIVLAGFIALGAIWIYTRLDDAFEPSATYESLLADRPGDAAAIRQHDDAVAAVERDRATLADARDDLELDREAYRTAIEAGQPTGELRRAYEQAQAALAEAEGRLSSAEARERSTRRQADEARERVARELEGRSDRARLWAFLARLGYTAGLLVAAFGLLNGLRRRRSRLLPVGYAAVAATTLLAFALAGDYTTDYFDVTDLGPLVLSLLGVVLSLASFVALQRYLQRRIPARRVRRRECPFCGFPVTGNEHCEGCGRAVIAACARCRSPRRVGTTHCGVCGQT